MTSFIAFAMRCCAFLQDTETPLCAPWLTSSFCVGFPILATIAWPYCTVLVAMLQTPHATSSFLMLFINKSKHCVSHGARLWKLKKHLTSANGVGAGQANRETHPHRCRLEPARQNEQKRESMCEREAKAKRNARRSSIPSASFKSRPRYASSGAAPWQARNASHRGQYEANRLSSLTSHAIWNAFLFPTPLT